MSDASRTWIERYTGTLSQRDLNLLERAVAVLEANTLTTRDSQPLPWYPRRGIIPSPTTYHGVWNWDAAFHAVGVSRWDVALAREQIEIILDAQLPSGALPDVIFSDGRIVRDFGKPPVMPWAASMVDQRLNDSAFTQYCYERFVPYEAHWRAHRGGDGLFHYDSEAADPVKRENDAKLESGWDNSVRWDKGARNLWAVDLNCFMVMLYRAMQYFAGKLSQDADHWRAAELRLSDKINAQLWDETARAYKDFDFQQGHFSDVLSPASFMPLYIGIAPPERAGQMAALAADANRFFPGMPTVSYDNPAYAGTDFWRGPTWLNTAYFALKGLKQAGHSAVADLCRDTILNWCATNEDTIYEYYDSKTGQAAGARQFSWSAIFVIEFILNWDKA
jgi:putative isomerase